MEIGSRIRHIKRGTTYEVIAATSVVTHDHTLPRRDARVFEPTDHAEAAFVVVNSMHDGMAWHGIVRPGFVFDASDDWVVLRLPLLLQMSGPNAGHGDWLVYRQTDGAMVFARPENEFTPDRFEVL